MRIPEEWLPVVRNFEDRGFQALLQVPEHVRGLLCIIARDVCERLDFSRMVCEPVSFVARNLRKREADVVLRVPFRGASGSSPAEVWIYILIEHQSKPDEEILFRILYGMASLWNKQSQEFDRKKVPIAERRYFPILPVVLYTGDAVWDIDAPLTSLMDVPEALAKYQPRFSVLSLDVKAKDPGELTESDHPFAWIMRVLQEDGSPLERLRAVAAEAMQHLNALEGIDPTAFEVAFVFLILLLYHRREPADADRLVETMAEVRPASARKEAIEMAKTFAQELIEEGEARGESRGFERGEARGTVRAKRSAVLTLLREKFGPLPRPVVKHVRSLEDTKTLDGLLKRFVHADSLEAMGF